LENISYAPLKSSVKQIKAIQLVGGEEGILFGQNGDSLKLFRVR